jgi:hypothetical protein
VADAERAGVVIDPPETEAATVVHVGRGTPAPPPDHPVVRVIGDAAGTSGLAAALRAAADLARRL